MSDRAPLSTLYLLLPRAPEAPQQYAERITQALGGTATVATDPSEGWRLEHTEGPMPWRIRPTRAPDVSVHGPDLEELSDAVRDAITGTTWALRIDAGTAGDDAIERVEALFQLARAVAPEAVGVVDEGSDALRSGAWLAETGLPGVPLPLDAIYRIHAVSGEDASEPLWMHTHGLARAGLAEIELVGVPPADLTAAGALLRSVAHRALVHGLPTLGQPIDYAHGLSAALVPWRYVESVHEADLGGAAERDDSHGPDNLVLVEWVPTSDTAGRWVCVAERLAELGEHPVFFLTDYETERQEALARLRWRAFSTLVSHYGGVGGWRFLGKFGLSDPADGVREHLWFDVHHADPTTADGVLVNAPHRDLGLAEGDRAALSIDQLTDFRVWSPFGSATPDSIDDLMRRVLADMDAGAGADA